MWEKYGIQVEIGVMRSSTAASGRRRLYAPVVRVFFGLWDTLIRLRAWPFSLF